MKTLLTNGCSWTWGGGIDNYMSDEDRIKNVWPHHLMNLLNLMLKKIKYLTQKTSKS
jgi:hypothetical protein